MKCKGGVGGLAAASQGQGEAAQGRAGRAVVFGLWTGAGMRCEKVGLRVSKAGEELAKSVQLTITINLH